MSEDPFFNRLRARLLGRPVGVFGEVSPGEAVPRPASVLISLFRIEGALQILFIRRTEELPTHPGQIAFPGGSREPGDADDWRAATREAREEIGLREEDCEPLGALDRLVTFTGFDISPFVARIPHPYAFKPAPGEVAEILILPFDGFLQPSAYQPVIREFRGVTREIPELPRQGHPGLGGHRLSGPAAAGAREAALVSARRKPGIYPLILAGGSGTRFWPLSRRGRPKQFLPLAGKQPLLVETVRRLRGLAAPRAISIACGAGHARQIRRLLPEIPAECLLVEPVARNTAPAIGWAALRVQARDPNGVLVVLPSDHHVRDVTRFRALLAQAARLCADGTLYTLGIPPTAPETGYGYLRLGSKLQEGAREVRAFVEKPTLAKATSYLASGDYLWNSGIFVFRVDAILGGDPAFNPRARAGPRPRSPRRWARAASVRWSKRLFPRAPNISIDYGVMEKAPRVATLPADVGWSDLGSFGRALAGPQARRGRQLRRGALPHPRCPPLCRHRTRSAPRPRRRRRPRGGRCRGRGARRAPRS